MLTRIRSFAFIAFIAFILVAGMAPNLSRAHDTGGGDVILGPPGHDKPGPPPILTSVKLTTIEHPNMDDGAIIGNDDAEVTVSISLSHTGHGATTVAAVEEDLDYDATQGTWVINAEIYVHRECTPMEPITIYVTGFEADATNLSALESALLGIAGALAEQAALGIDAGFLSRIVGEAFATLNPDDTLGSGTTVVGGPGPASVTTSGGDYSITVNFNVVAPPVAGTECDPESIPPPDQDPPFCFFSVHFFDQLINAHGVVNNVQIESGNPGNLTAVDLNDTQTSLRSLIEKMAQWEAAHMVEDARGLIGFAPAHQHYQIGMTQTGIAAINEFRQAFCDAELAILNNNPDPNPLPMPPRATGVPQHMSTRSGRTVEYLTGVFGDGGGGIFSIIGGPPGASFVIEPSPPGHPSWHILRVHQNGPPGTYMVHVDYADPLVPTLHLTLDIDESATDVGEQIAIAPPLQFALHSVRPNPAAGTAFVRADFPTEAIVTLNVYDVAGRKVLELLRDASRVAGEHTFVIETRGLAPGVYSVRMEAQAMAGGSERFAQSQKFVVTR